MGELLLILVASSKAQICKKIHSNINIKNNNLQDNLFTQPHSNSNNFNNINKLCKINRFNNNSSYNHKIIASFNLILLITGWIKHLNRATRKILLLNNNLWLQKTLLRYLKKDINYIKGRNRCSRWSHKIYLTLSNNSALSLTQVMITAFLAPIVREYATITCILILFQIQDP